MTGTIRHAAAIGGVLLLLAACNTATTSTERAAAPVQTGASQATPAAPPAQLRSIVTRAGETNMVWPAVYWVDRRTCQSSLLAFRGVDVIESPLPVTLTLQPAQVVAMAQGCSNEIAGAAVMAKVDAVPAPVSGVLRFRVRYQPLSGPETQSNHAVMLNAYP
jgi:hypothetical protein